jgi:hypothetical protein
LLTAECAGGEEALVGYLETLRQGSSGKVLPLTLNQGTRRSPIMDGISS